MKPELYILELSNGQYYVGSTDNFDRRLLQHQHGKVISTKGKRPVMVALRESFLCLKLARQVEYKLKSYKNKDIIKQIIKDQKINFVGS